MARRVVLTILAGLAGMLVLTFAEVIFIGLIGNNIEGTGLVAFGLAPFAAVIGFVLSALLAWRRMRPVEAAVE